MNTKIQKLANALYNNEECKNQRFSLTLNYKKTIEHKYIHEDIPNTTAFRCVGIVYPLLNEEGMKKITDELSKVKVKNFNFTIEFEKGINHDDCEYDIDWYACRIVFHGKKKIEISFDMSSSYCSFDYDSFSRSVGKHKIKITDDKLDVTIQKMVELKNTLLENASKLINKLSEIKNL
jgi:hypothetical protein